MEQQYHVIFRTYRKDGTIFISSTLENIAPAPKYGDFTWTLDCIYTTRMVIGEMTAKYDTSLFADIWMEPL